MHMPNIPFQFLGSIFHIYSPNNLRTRFSTLSFSGSYGWSFEGISSKEGKAAVYVSTRCLIRSAIYYFLAN